MLKLGAFRKQIGRLHIDYVRILSEIDRAYITRSNSSQFNRLNRPITFFLVTFILIFFGGGHFKDQYLRE